MDDKSEQPSDPSGNEESDVTLVGFFLNANMQHGGRTPINQRRTGANPTQQLRVNGSPMGTDPTQMYGPGQAVPGYNNPAMQTAHRNDRMGLLNPPSLLSSPAAFHPNQSPMAQQPQQAQYFGNMPSQDYFNTSMMAGMQQHANSGYGQTVQLPTVYQLSRSSNGPFNGYAQPSHPQPAQQRAVAVPLVPPQARPAENVAGASGSHFEMSYDCMYCISRGVQPYRYEDTEDGKPPSLVVCRSEHLMESEDCKKMFTDNFGTEWKKASGDDCVDNEVIKEKCLCLLCNEYVPTKGRQLHLRNKHAILKAGLVQQPPQAPRQDIPPLNDQQMIQLQSDQKMFQLFQQQQQQVQQLREAHQSQVSYPTLREQSQYRQGLAQTHVAAPAITPPVPAYQQPPNISVTQAEQGRNVERLHRIVALVESTANNQPPFNAGGQAGEMSPAGGNLAVSEPRPSTASSISQDGGTPRDSIGAFEDISPQGSPAPAVVAPQSSTAAVVPADRPAGFRSTMQITQDVMNDPNSYRDMVLPEVSSQNSYTQETERSFAAAQLVEIAAAVSSPVDAPLDVAPQAAPDASGDVIRKSAAVAASAQLQVLPVITSPHVEEKKQTVCGSDAVPDMAEGGKKKDIEVERVIKREPKDEKEESREAAANDFCDVFYHNKRPGSPPLAAAPPHKKAKMATGIHKVSASTDPGIHKKKKDRPQEVASSREVRERTSLIYICICGELCPRKRDYWVHHQRHAFNFRELSDEQKELFCVRKNCNYLASNTIDYTRHAARHIMLQTAYREQM